MRCCCAAWRDTSGSIGHDCLIRALNDVHLLLHLWEKKRYIMEIACVYYCTVGMKDSLFLLMMRTKTLEHNVRTKNTAMAFYSKFYNFRSSRPAAFVFSPLWIQLKQQQQKKTNYCTVRDLKGGAAIVGYLVFFFCYQVHCAIVDDWWWCKTSLFVNIDKAFHVLQPTYEPLCLMEQQSEEGTVGRGLIRISED